MTKSIVFVIVSVCVCLSVGHDCPTTVYRQTCANETELASRIDVLHGKIQKLSEISEKMMKMLDEIKTLKLTCKQMKKEEVDDSPVDGSYPKDCGDLYKRGNRTSGVHYVFPSGADKPFKVYCELVYQGWTLIMRRFSGNVDFFRDWAAYKAGFGRLSGEHWLGNDWIHLLTSQPGFKYKVKVEMVFWKNNLSYYQECEDFKVGTEKEKYKLTMSTCKGTVGFDGMTHYHNQAFSTFDSDNDQAKDKNCALSFKGGWWYSYCHVTNPTGTYKESCDNHQCMEWKHEPLREIMFKIRAV